MTERDALFYCLDEGIFRGNEKSLIKHCQWLIRLTNEGRETHYRCASYLTTTIRYPDEDVPLEGLLCQCKVCRTLQAEAVESIQKHRQERIRDQEERKRNKQSKESTNIYVMRNERNGFVKIGRSKAPLDREATLQSEDPEITLLFHFPAPVQVETQLHAIYQDRRIRGEWFRLTDDEIQAVRELGMQ